MSLRTKKNSAGFRWERRGDVFFSDHAGPVDGEVGFYLSDVVGAAGLPAAHCRPSVSVSRSVFLFLLFFCLSFRPGFLIGLSFCRKPNFTISYQELGAAFRMARHLHDPEKFTPMEGDENMLLEAMQGPSSGILAAQQERQDFERALAQECQDFERALAQERAQRQKLELIFAQQRGMSGAGRASGGSSSSSSRPGGGSGRRFFATLPKKPHEAAIAPWRRLLAHLPRKW